MKQMKYIRVSKNRKLYEICTKNKSNKNNSVDCCFDCPNLVSTKQFLGEVHEILCKNVLVRSEYIKIPIKVDI
jgi:predicted aldo/keto reductase-like oxidoreductase